MNITLYNKYIRHDVDQWTYRLAEMRIEDWELKSSSQSDDTTTDTSFYLRLIEEAIAHLILVLGDKYERNSSNADDKLSLNKTSWVLDVKENDDFKADSNALAELFHHFVVRYVILHWAEIYAEASTATLASELNALEAEIKNKLYDIDLPTKHRRQVYKETSSVEVEVTNG